MKVENQNDDGVKENNDEAKKTVEDGQSSKDDGQTYSNEGLSKDEIIEKQRSTISKLNKESQGHRESSEKFQKQITDAEKKLQEESGEYKKLYEAELEGKKDYQELKEFREKSLLSQQAQIDEFLPSLTKEQTDIFEIAKKTMPLESQMTFLTKLKSQDQSGSTNAGDPPASGRKEPITLDKKTLLNDSKLMKELKEKDPDKYYEIMEIRRP